MGSPVAESAWQKVFDDLVIDAQPASAPGNDDSSQWYQTIARFGRQGFLRILFAEEASRWVLHMQFAPGSSAEHADHGAPALASVLVANTPARWSVTSDALPWELRAEIDRSEEEQDRLRKTFIKLMKLADDVAAEASFDEILATLGGSEQAAEPARNPSSIFEDIGAPASKTSTTSGPPTMSEAAARATKTHVEVLIGFGEILSPAQEEDLEAALEHHLRIKFDVRVQPFEDAGASGIAPRKTGTRSAIKLELASADESIGVGELHEMVSSYMRRIEEFSSLGVSLTDILGLRETVLTSPPTTSPAMASKPLGAPGPVPRQESLGDEVIFDLAGSGIGGSARVSARVSAGGKDLLAPGHFEDERLRRPDATTPLVDIVLRHPGYSDMRIGQVLSILLSIEYHRALAIAERAPCVIAWGLGQDRARSFKEVIESAGGKVLLVEPGSFGES